MGQPLNTKTGFPVLPRRNPGFLESRVKSHRLKAPGSYTSSLEWRTEQPEKVILALGRTGKALRDLYG